ncbi:hypothetical protein CsSME_00045155 [Camellia sinensis var. sinensis]
MINSWVQETAQTPTGGNPRKHKEHSEYPYLLKHLAISTIGKQANLIILAEVIDPFQQLFPYVLAIAAQSSSSFQATSYGGVVK